jgi:hypothetical protein
MSGDAGMAADAMAVRCACGHPERGFGTTAWNVQRWDADQTQWVKRKTGLAEPQGHDFLAVRVKPYKVSETTGNLITNAGYTRIGNLFTAQGATQAFDAAHCRIGAGNGVTAVAYADTDLSASAGSTNRWFQLVSAVFTIGATRTWTVAATFGTADGNFTWQEFGIDQGTASGNTVTAILLNHALSSQGTKASGQTWTATATITWT